MDHASCNSGAADGGDATRLLRVAPGMLRVVAQQPSCLLDRQQSFPAGHLTSEPNIRKLFGGELRARSFHDGVGGGDDEGFEPWQLLLERLEHRLCAVAGIDVAPEIPAA